MPLALVLPSCARPNRVVIRSSKRATVAPRTSTCTCATSSPAFHQSCGVPGGTSTTSPGPAVRSSPSTRRPDPPREHLEALRHLGGARAPRPRRRRAPRTDRRPSARDRRRPRCRPSRPPRSPVTGLVSTWPRPGHARQPKAAVPGPPRARRARPPARRGRAPRPRARPAPRSAPPARRPATASSSPARSRAAESSSSRMALSRSLTRAATSSLWTAPSIPFTNPGASAPHSSLAASIASSIATSAGTSSRLSSSCSATRRMLRSSGAMRSSVQPSAWRSISASSCSRSASTPSTSSR